MTTSAEIAALLQNATAALATIRTERSRTEQRIVDLTTERDKLLAEAVRLEAEAERHAVVARDGLSRIRLP